MSPTSVAEQPRKVLRNNQLALVVGQIRFPRLPRFTDESYTVGFEEAMRLTYPKATPGETVELVVTTQGVQRKQGARQLRFTSMDERFSVVLSAESITLECYNYDTDISEFADRFATVAADAKKYFDLQHQLRIGLRYVNEFRHKDRRTYAAWRESFTQEFLGWDPSALGGRVINSIAEFTLHRENGTFVLRRGFLSGTTVIPLKVSPPKEPQEFYLFDMDYYNDVETKYESDPRQRFETYSKFMLEVLEKAVTPETLSWLKGQHV